MTSRRLTVLTAALIAVALVLPSTASAWKWTFRDFGVGGGGNVKVTVKKCKGGKVGNYQYLGRFSSPTLQHEARATMPAFPKFRDLKNVKLTLSGDTGGLPPETLAEIINAFTAWYEATMAKYNVKKGKITFKYPAMVLFGSELFPAGTHTEKFKPKKGC